MGAVERPDGMGVVVVRVAGTVVGLTVAALALAWWAVGWPVLLVGVPLLLGVVLLLGAVALSRAPRRKLQAHRAARFDQATIPAGGLMSGFFALPDAHQPVARH